MAENQARAPRMRPDALYAAAEGLEARIIVRGEGPYQVSFEDGDKLRVNYYMSVAAMIHDVALEMAKPGARLSLENRTPYEASLDGQNSNSNHTDEA